MNVQVLISCMYQNDTSIIQRSNIQGDVVVVNQCNEEKIERFVFKNSKGKTCKALFINTTERGLSRSRNMAINNAWGDICVICDDDEVFYDNYIEVISNAYQLHPATDLICMEVERPAMKLMSKRTLNYLNALKVASVTITFKLSSILKEEVKFDDKIGSGVSCAGGEENVFLYDCLKHSLNGIILPISFAKLIKGESKWFKGYTREYFYDRGILTSRMMNRLYASFYAIYFLIFKRNKYRTDISMFTAAKQIFKGIFY